jgi:hypothetical protein
VRRVIQAVRDRLDGNTILPLGSDLDRLTETAYIAADHGLSLNVTSCRCWGGSGCGATQTIASA